MEMSSIAKKRMSVKLDMTGIRARPFNTDASFDDSELSSLEVPKSLFSSTVSSLRFSSELIHPGGDVVLSESIVVFAGAEGLRLRISRE